MLTIVSDTIKDSFLHSPPSLLYSLTAMYFNLG